ncbi:MAG: hypothetical protein WA206_16955 [Candidatus Binatus sp.]
MASTKRIAQKAHKKYVPSARQLAEDERIKATLDHLTAANVKKFDRLLAKAIKPTR